MPDPKAVYNTVTQIDAVDNHKRRVFVAGSPRGFALEEAVQAACIHYEVNVLHCRPATAAKAERRECEAEVHQSEKGGVIVKVSHRDALFDRDRRFAHYAIA